MLARQLEETKANNSYLGEVIEVQLSDCVLLGDQRGTKEMVEHRDKAKAKPASQRLCVEQLAYMFIPKTAEFAKRALTKGQTKKFQESVHKDRSRLYSS